MLDFLNPVDGSIAIHFVRIDENQVVGGCASIAHTDQAGLDDSLEPHSRILRRFDEDV